MARITPRGGAVMQSDRTIDERLERQKLTFEAIFRLVEKIGTSFDVSKIVSLFLMTLMGQLKTRCAAIYLVAPEQHRLEPYRLLGCARGDTLPSFDLESMFVRWLCDTTVPARIDEFFGAMGDAAEEGEAMRRLADAGLSHAILLSEQEDRLGMLMYGGTVTGEPFGVFEEEIVRMLARVASITIKNAFLYQAAVDSKRELEHFAQVKREFIGHTSHELRTPLTVLKSALWSLEPEAVDEGVLVDMAKDAVTRLHGKVEYLLSLNDLELNSTDFKFEQAEVSSIIEDVLRELLPEIEEKHIRVATNDEARYRKILVDSKKMAIVIRSVLENAVTFARRGGNIAVTVRVSQRGPGGDEGTALGEWCGNAGSAQRALPARCEGTIDGSSYLVVVVEDDGIGIPPDEIATLAEPFTMASNSTNRNVRGLGIGLSVSQKIVAGHGGAIFCRSEPDKGSAFSIWLPIDS